MVWKSAKQTRRQALKRNAVWAGPARGTHCLSCSSSVILLRSLKFSLWQEETRFSRVERYSWRRALLALAESLLRILRRIVRMDLSSPRVSGNLLGTWTPIWPSIRFSSLVRTIRWPCGDWKLWESMQKWSLCMASSNLRAYIWIKS